MTTLNLQSPPSVLILSIVGAAQDNDFLTVFAIGNDGNLWGRTFFASQWLPWASLGHPQSGALSNSGNDLGRAVVASGKGTWWIFCVNASGTISVAMKATRESMAWTWTDIPKCPTDKKFGSVHGAKIEQPTTGGLPCLIVDYSTVPEKYNTTFYADSTWSYGDKEWRWGYWYSTGNRAGGFNNVNRTGIRAGIVSFQLKSDGTIDAIA